jgi:hypothetical protein
VGRIGDLGWAIRDRLGGTAVAVVLALAGLGAGVAALVIALDAKDKAEEAASTAETTPASVPIPTAPDPAESAKVDELNERVAAIEESVAQLRTEVGDTAAPDTGEATVPAEPSAPDAPELPEGIEIPGVPAPDGEAPPRP